MRFTDKPWVVRASPDDVARCEEAGKLAAQETRMRHMTTWNVATPYDRNWGVAKLGEAAAGFLLGVEPGEKWHEPDLKNKWEVRARARKQESGFPPAVGFTMRDSERPFIPFILAIVDPEGDGGALIELNGWITPAEGMRRWFHFRYPRYHPHGIWFVPMERLHPMSELPAYETDQHRAVRRAPVA